MPAENSFSYKRTLKPIPIMDVHFSLLRAKTLCLAGVRSRYADNSTRTNNTFTIRVTKAGILDRKYDLTQGGKKATARGWRPFGVILSGSQIIFFADVSSFQNWLDEEERHQKLQQKGHQKDSSSSSISDMPPRRNNSVPAFSSIVTAESSSSNLSVNNATVTSMSSLYNNSNNMTPIPTISSSTTTNSLLPVNSHLRPVQIVSLSYAICIYDEDYTKYPHVFRLITGDGQQFLLRAEDEKDMEDWMLKINYAATLKTTGVRMRPTKRPSVHDTKSLDRSKREEKAREKVQELSDRIDEQVKLLDRELQLRRNLMVLVPCQKSTKDRILSFADTLGKKLKSKRIELQRLECYRDYLECELSWCTSQQQQPQSRKMSLPLPSHLYSFIPPPISPDQPASATLPASLDKRESIKKLTNLVFTAPSEESSSVPNTASSSSTTTSSHNMLLKSSSAVSGDEHDETEEERIVISKSSSSDSRISLSSEQDDEDEEESSPTPQLPPFAFPKSFVEGINFMDSKNVKTASNNVVEMDRMMRRRSQSNPAPINRQIVDKKLLLLEPPKQLVGRQRSGSETSSVQGDDDDMSVIIVNDSEELLADSSSWQNTIVSNE